MERNKRLRQREHTQSECEKVNTVNMKSDIKHGRKTSRASLNASVWFLYENVELTDLLIKTTRPDGH